MSNKAPKTPKPKSQQRPPLHNQDKNSRQKIAIGAVSALVTLVGLAASILTFLPHILPSASDPVDPNNPFSSSITIANTGSIPLDDVGFEVAIRHIPFPTGGSINESEDYGFLLVPDVGAGRYLGAGDRFQFPFNSVLDGNKDDLLSADIALVIFYEIPYIHLRRERLFPVKLTRQSNGNFYWYFEPEPRDYHVADHGYRITAPMHIPHVTGPQKPN